MGAPKPLTTNELWRLELQTKSILYIGLHTRCIMGYAQISLIDKWVEALPLQDRCLV